MVTGYGGFYRGSVIDNLDPLGQRRLHVLVPEIFDTEPVWAVASITDDSGPPEVDELVWISFEHGDSDYPVWQRPAGSDQPQGEARRYAGKYHGRVVDNDDPLQERRVRVVVPEVDDTNWAWAAAGPEVADLDVPEIDTMVWIEYEYGDPAYPRWVGLG